MQRASSSKLYLIPLAAALIASASVALIGSATTSEIQGIALVGGKPQANVVVWIDAPKFASDARVAHVGGRPT